MRHEKILKLTGDHNKMTLREYWDYTINCGVGSHDFCISAFTGNG